MPLADPETHTQGIERSRSRSQSQPRGGQGRSLPTQACRARRLPRSDGGSSDQWPLMPCQGATTHTDHSNAQLATAAQRMAATIAEQIGCERAAAAATHQMQTEQSSHSSVRSFMLKWSPAMRAAGSGPEACSAVKACRTAEDQHGQPAQQEILAMFPWRLQCSETWFVTVHTSA